MKAASAKKKGLRLEKECAKDLRHAGFKSAKKQPRSGAYVGFEGDIFCSELPISWEMKNHERWSVHKYMEQAIKDAKKTNKFPVVVMSRNRMPEPYVMLKWKDFLNILQRAFIENDTPPTTGTSKESFSKHQQLNNA